MTSPAVTTSTGPRRRRRPAALVAVLVLAAVAVLAVSALQLRGVSSREEDRDELLGTARQAAVAFTSYDHADLDSSFDAVLALATDQFSQQFTAASAQLRPIITEKKATARGEVLGVGLERYEEGEDTASVLVATDATVTNTEFPDGALQRFRLRVTLERGSSGWRVDEITPVV